MITAQLDHKYRATQSGARDFINKPFNRAEVLLRVANVMEIQLPNKELLGQDDLLLDKVRERTAELRASYFETAYPHGIMGDAIPYAARILKICDIYDALRSERPYKRALGHAEALDIIVSGDDRTSPDHFDPAVLAAFVQEQAACRELFEEYPA